MPPGDLDLSFGGREVRDFEKGIGGVEAHPYDIDERNPRRSTFPS